jgi:hypothetical protein
MESIKPWKPRGIRVSGNAEFIERDGQFGPGVYLVPAEGPPAFEDMVTMVNWFNEYGYQADIPALRKRLPTLMNFETWLRANNWENMGVHSLADARL